MKVIIENNFSSNLKRLRKEKGMTQEELAKQLDKDYSTIGKWENGTRSPIMLDVLKIAELFELDLNELVQTNIIYDEPKTNKIAIYGSIKAGLPLESQNDIVEYMDVPKKWLKGNKQLFGLKISGDSMMPKYQNGEIVIFERTDDIETYKNKDCAVMINGTESTFKKVQLNDNGIVLQPYNASYDIQFYSNEDIKKLPVSILGKAIKKVSDIE